MSNRRKFVAAGCVSALGICLVASSDHGSAQTQLTQAQLTQAQLTQSSPMEVTTDTPQYCQHLLGRIGDLIRLAATPVPHDVTDLRDEGRRMCDHGQTRGGIMRLRSALMMMEKPDGAAYR